jgi:outer membrane murein-binding lipoprotein Lpp
MKTLTQSTILCALALLAGCQSSGHNAVDKTSVRMQELRSDIETLKMRVTSNASSLVTLVEKADTDPKPEFSAFSKSTKEIESSFKRAQSRLEQTQTEASKLFSTWTANATHISDPDLKEASDKRRENLKGTLDEVINVTQSAIEELKSYVATSNDLVTYLKQDLTPAGVRGIAGKSKSQAKAAETISEKLDDVIEAADKASTEFKTAKPPPPAEPAPKQ